MARKRMVTRTMPFLVAHVTVVSKTTKEVEEREIKVIGVDDIDNAVARITEGFKGTDTVLVSAEEVKSGKERYGMEESVFLNMAKNLEKEECPESDTDPTGVAGGEE